MKREKVLFVLLSLQILISIISFSQNKKADANIIPVQLYCEYRKNPVGIDELKPRLSWSCKAGSAKSRGLAQTAYQIIVATSGDLLLNDKGDIWNSGKVISDQSVLIGYSGKPLVSHTWYYWKVRIFDREQSFRME